MDRFKVNLTAVFILPSFKNNKKGKAYDILLGYDREGQKSSPGEDVNIFSIPYNPLTFNKNGGICLHCMHLPYYFIGAEPK